MEGIEIGDINVVEDNSGILDPMVRAIFKVQFEPIVSAQVLSSLDDATILGIAMVGPATEFN